MMRLAASATWRRAAAALLSLVAYNGTPSIPYSPYGGLDCVRWPRCLLAEQVRKCTRRNLGHRTTGITLLG